MSKTSEIHVFINDKLDNETPVSNISKSVSSLFGLKYEIARQMVEEIVGLRLSVGLK